MAKKEIKTLVTRNVIADGDKLIVNTTDNQTVQVSFSLFSDLINKKIADIKVGTINLVSSMKPITFSQTTAGAGTSVLLTDEDDHYYQATPAPGSLVGIYHRMLIPSGRVLTAGIYVRQSSMENATISIYCDSANAESQKTYSMTKGQWMWISTRAFSVEAHGNLIIHISQVDVALDYKKVFYSEGNIPMTGWAPSLEEMGLTQ